MAIVSLTSILYLQWKSKPKQICLFRKNSLVTMASTCRIINKWKPTYPSNERSYLSSTLMSVKSLEFPKLCSLEPWTSVLHTHIHTKSCGQIRWWNIKYYSQSWKLSVHISILENVGSLTGQIPTCSNVLNTAFPNIKFLHMKYTVLLPIPTSKPQCPKATFGTACGTSSMKQSLGNTSLVVSIYTDFAVWIIWKAFWVTIAPIWI